MYIIGIMNIEYITECLTEGAIILDGLDGCILGYSDTGLLIYSYDKLIESFCADGMSQEEAYEWVDYNILGLLGNGEGFIICL